MWERRSPSASQVRPSIRRRTVGARIMAAYSKTPTALAFARSGLATRMSTPTSHHTRRRPGRFGAPLSGFVNGAAWRQPARRAASSGRRVAPEESLVDRVVGEPMGVVAIGTADGDAETVALQSAPGAASPRHDATGSRLGGGVPPGGGRRRLCALPVGRSASRGSAVGARGHVVERERRVTPTCSADLDRRPQS